MPVKLRLQRHGRKKAPFYHIVVADSRSPRDGRFIEKIGTYNPMTKPATIILDGDAAYNWLQNGAQPTDTVNAILRFKGVLYKKHLMRGVAKGAMSMEDAITKYEAFVKEKDSNLTKRVEETKKEKQDKHQFIFGTPKAKKVKEAPVAEAPAEEAMQETNDAVVENNDVAVETAPVVEAAAEEVAPVTEAVVEETVAEVVVEQGVDQEMESIAEETAPEAPADETPVADAPADETTEA